ncbi:carboxymuconolactone decarboxylase family protein [Psychrosphaera haliotis]|uniref:Carboxymuconolactone decarboxylase family protein n=1 Tax=Psychrosphaera haliotis TaxID=555083 RepID=A0A6N8F3I7_9GAMM|nr:carboxymuconolactone decarboxylase family protein [Psychrosphaera haliotis]MUH71226.1 carboxymuconolactone decarboxylase family protein [Psychrosphaera haliotis]
MTKLTIQSLESAPSESKPLLQKSIDAYGMLPNLHGVLASAPSALDAYQQMHELFVNTSFDAEELTVVWQGINVEHGCTYCVPAHTGIAHSMKVSQELIDALRNEQPLPSAKLQALLDMTLEIVRERGRVSEESLKAFYDAGYGERQVLEIILGVSQKVISNYTNHIANTPVDAPFQQFAWEKKAK